MTALAGMQSSLSLCLPSLPHVHHRAILEATKPKARDCETAALASERRAGDMQSALSLCIHGAPEPMITQRRFWQLGEQSATAAFCVRLLRLLLDSSLHHPALIDTRDPQNQVHASRSSVRTPVGVHVTAKLSGNFKAASSRKCCGFRISHIHRS